MGLASPVGHHGLYEGSETTSASSNLKPSSKFYLSASLALVAWQKQEKWAKSAQNKLKWGKTVADQLESTELLMVSFV